MFRFVFRKIISNRWKVLCLLVGSILVVAMLSSIPIYTNGTTQRMLIKEMEQVQLDEGVYPGYYVIDAALKMSGSDTRVNYLNKLENIASRTTRDYVRSPIAAAGRIVELGSLRQRIPREDGTSQSISLSFKNVLDFENQAEVVSGRMYQPGLTDDGVVEAVVTERYYQTAEMSMDRTYPIYSVTNSEEPVFDVRIVGIVRLANPSDVYWYEKEISLGASLLIGGDAVQSLVTSESGDQLLEQATWFFAYDYHQMRVEQTEAILEGYEQQINEFLSFMTFNPVSFPLAETLQAYPAREARLMLTLSILIIPIVLMLVFYIFMVAQLKVQSEANEISVLQSRGARKRQILKIYFLESLILGGISLAAGPPLGLLMCRVLGASNGFLEFVARQGMSLRIGWGALAAGLAAVLLFIITTLIPVLLNARLSIVMRKRLQSRGVRRPLWQRLFLDILLLGVSLYGLYSLNQQLQSVDFLTGSAETGNVDFILYLSSTVFALGAGLLFLRLYPMLMRLVSRAGAALWSPVSYASIHQVTQARGQSGFLMLFLILSLSIGIFSADSARTINRHIEDNTRCLVGADLRLVPQWPRYDIQGNVLPEDEVAMGIFYNNEDATVYHEPDPAVYEHVDGTDSFVRVMNKLDVFVQSGIRSEMDVHLLAVDSYDFAQTAWNRSDLNPYHINSYMNVLTELPQAVILSSSLGEALQVDIGDSIRISSTGSPLECVVVAFADYWPGFVPREVTADGTVEDRYLAVVNLGYYFQYNPMEPYEVWMTRSDGVTDASVYQSIGDNRIRVTDIQSANQDVATLKSDLILQGTNGMFSLGFIVSMMVCAVGFLIYWILSIQGRVLQFGVFRAIGMSKKEIIGIILTEQVLISGVAIGIGFAIGRLGSALFVPLFKLVYASPDQPIPFQVISYASDYLKILLVIGTIVVLGFVALSRYVLRTRMDQAIKLGEE